VNNVNFALSVNTFVPRSVHFVSVSTFPVLIDFFPDYRDYSFFVVEDEIVFVDDSRRVVDIVPAGPRARFSSRATSSTTLNLSQAEIREVQQVLIDRGFLTGEVDGVFSARTRTALIAFQRQQGIRATGSIDTRTVASLGLSNRVGQQSSQGASGAGRSSTTGQATTGQGRGGAARSSGQQNMSGRQGGQANAPMPQNQSTTTGQGQSGTQQPSAQQNQSTTGQGGGGQQSAGDQNMRPGSGNQSGGSAPSTSGQGNMQQPPAQNPQNQNQRSR
jgi:peptidoglycan hydrolase-like protein with peptidoglycan-binding domain